MHSLISVVASIFQRLKQKMLKELRHHPLSQSKDVILGDIKAADDQLEVCFVPVPGAGHFGYMASGRIVHPYHSKIDPDGDTD